MLPADKRLAIDRCKLLPFLSSRVRILPWPSLFLVLSHWRHSPRKISVAGLADSDMRVADTFCNRSRVGWSVCFLFALRRSVESYSLSAFLRFT